MADSKSLENIFFGFLSQLKDKKGQKNQVNSLKQNYFITHQEAIRRTAEIDAKNCTEIQGCNITTNELAYCILCLIKSTDSSDKHQCKGITHAGYQCSRQVSGNDYCFQHIYSHDNSDRHR